MFLFAGLIYKMCGIAGIITTDQSTPDPNRLKRMVDILQHRGPDAEGEFIRPGIQLGFRRLSIIDLSDAGNQPMTDPSGRYTIVYNGEVYNYLELRGNLKPHFNFRSKTDTEVVLATYIQFGEKCLKKLNGMFAFAIWDNEKRELFLARDRLGIKPLFYSQLPNGLVFASEQKAIIASGLIKPEINHESIYHFMSFYHFPEPQTAFKNIYSLPAAHQATFKDSELKTKRWWSTDFRKSAVNSDMKASDGVRMFLEDSTRIRQVADVPVGCFLSGGMDSTAVSALMHKEVGPGFKTYTIAFGNDPSNAQDVYYARAAALRIGTDHLSKNISMAEIEKQLPSILWHLEEPAWTSLESWFVSKLARQGIKVALAGVGGDELFAGYFPYSHMARLESFNTFMGPLAKPTGMLARLINQFVPDNLKQNPPGSSLHRYATIENLDYASAYFFLRSTFTDDEKKQLFTPDFMKEVKGLSSLGYVRDLMRKTKTEGYIDKFASFDIQNYLAADLLRHLDSMSMAHSLETRVPLLDHRLVEFILGLTDEMKLRDGKSKFIFKKAIDDYIPDEIKSRKKVGFVFPMKKWMRTEFSPEISRVLKSDRFYQRGIFNPGSVDRLLQNYIAGDESQWLRIWSILSVELWARMYIDSDGTNPKEVGFRDFVE